MKAMVKEDVSKLKQLEPLSAEEHTSWKGCHGFSLSGNMELLYLRDDQASTLKVFDTNGIEKGCIQINHDILGLLCTEGTDQNMHVIMTRGDKSTELRDARDPSMILDSMKSQYGSAAACQTSGNSIMLGQSADAPSTATEYEIIDGKFGKLKRKVDIPLKVVVGFATASSNNRKLLVMPGIF